MSDDAPGGPIDPEKVFDAIAAGAVVPEGGDHFITPDRWLRVNGTAWEIADVEAVRISCETAAAIRGATKALPFLVIDGLRWRLDHVDGWAGLVPG